MANFGHIKNPLTIIAIFSAVSETSGAAVLPFLTPENQNLYIWFLIIFPFFLVSIFFGILNFNHSVLYAPSDFRDEGNFFRGVKTASPAESVAKLEQEVHEIQNNETNDTDQTTSKEIIEELKENPNKTSRDDTFSAKLSRYIFAEDLVINKIQREFGGPIRRDSGFITPRGSLNIFDGIMKDGERYVALEVKYSKNPYISPSIIRKTMDKATTVFNELPEDIRSKFTFLLAIASDSKMPNSSDAIYRIKKIIDYVPFPVEIRIYYISDLEKNDDDHSN